MEGGGGRERSPFFDFLLHFYIVRSRAKVSTAVDISRYEWAATATIFPSSCYAVSFFDGSPAHAIYLSREGERRQRPSDRSASLNPPPPPLRGRKQHARMEEDTPLPGVYFQARKNRFRKRPAQFTRGRASGGPLVFKSHPRIIRLPSNHASTRSRTHYRDRTFREIISSIRREREREEIKWILLIPFRYPFFTRLVPRRVNTKWLETIVRSVEKITRSPL